MLRPLPLRLGLAIAAVLAIVSSSLLVARQHPSQLRIIWPALAGDGALVITPDDRIILIDGGADGATLATWLGTTLPFGRRRIDAVVLTRSDPQTLPGQLAAIKRYGIGTALVGGGGEHTSSVDMWQHLLHQQHTAIHTVAAGDQFMVGTCRIDLLTRHEDRFTFKLACGTTTAYFLQAIDAEAENELTARTLDPATLVVYPWSRKTNTPLLHTLDPKALVFSDDGRSTELRWSDRTVGSARLLHEALDGQIELIDDGHTVQIDGERDDDRSYDRP